jgi:hypothetical protein
MIGKLKNRRIAFQAGLGKKRKILKNNQSRKSSLVWLKL